MAPEIAKLRPLPAYYKQTRTRTSGGPAFARTGISLAQPHVGERRVQARPHDSLALQLDFIDSVRSFWIATITDVVHHEHANAGDGLDSFTRPFLHQVRRNHSNRCVRRSVGVNMDRRQRHQRFSRAAFGHDGRRLPLLPAFSDSHNGNSLGGKGLPKQSLDTGRNWILKTLERGVILKNSVPELMGEKFHVIENRLELRDCCLRLHRNLLAASPPAWPKRKMVCFYWETCEERRKNCVRLLNRRMVFRYRIGGNRQNALKRNARPNGGAVSFGQLNLTLLNARRQPPQEFFFRPRDQHRLTTESVQLG